VETAGAEQGRVLVSVDDIQAEHDPGLAYAVYLTVPNDPDRDRRHIGNISFFGIELMNDPDRAHDGPPGFPHVFDATDVVRQLKQENRWDPAAVTVTFDPIRVLPPPGGELPPEVHAAAIVSSSTPSRSSCGGGRNGRTSSWSSWRGRPWWRVWVGTLTVRPRPTRASTPCWPRSPCAAPSWAGGRRPGCRPQRPGQVTA
jgi:hypothetical protein